MIYREPDIYRYCVNMNVQICVTNLKSTCFKETLKLNLVHDIVILLFTLISMSMAFLTIGFKCLDNFGLEVLYIKNFVIKTNTILLLN